MPRTPRDDAPGAAHHHFHLVVRSGSIRISRLMARLGTGYARYFNQRHARVGHLFQNRFRSRRVTDDADLAGLVAYVCRNPLEASLAQPASLAAYRWCSASALLGRRAPFAFEDVRETLALFARDQSRARACLRDRLAVPGPEAGAPHERVHGARALAPAGPRGGRGDFASLVAVVCAGACVSEAELRSRRRTERIAHARSMLAQLAARELGVSGSELARRLGVTPSAVSRMLDRARRG